MPVFFDNFFPKYQFGFKKGCRFQQFLLTLLEKEKDAVDKCKVFGALLNKLSKTFDFLDHKHLIIKLHAYLFSLPALKLSHNYLTNRNREQK